MRTVGDLKRLIDGLPDKMPLIVGGNYDCDIVGLTINTFDGIARLDLTDGYVINKSDFVDYLFSLIPHGDNEGPIEALDKITEVSGWELAQTLGSTTIIVK